MVSGDAQQTGQQCTDLINFPKERDPHRSSGFSGRVRI